MPRPRVPYEKARLTGYAEKHNERFQTGGNHPPDYADPIGAPYDWLSQEAADAWHEFADTLPWLNRSHRSIVGLTANLAGRMQSGTLPDSGLNLLRLCLGSLGATPADFSKVGWTPPAEQDDLADRFFR